MKKLTLFLFVIAILALPFLSNAQFSEFSGNAITVVYEGKVPGPGGTGALRVSTSSGASHDYNSYPSSYSFASSGSFGGSFTFDFSHFAYPGWTTRLKTVSKSTFDSMPYNTPQKFYFSNSFYYEVTKQYGYSTVGMTYDYVLKVRGRDPRI